MRALLTRLTWLLSAGGLFVAAVATSGCSTEAFCFDQCAGQTTSSSSSSGMGGSGGGGGSGGSGGCDGLFCGSSSSSGMGGSGGCMQTNNGVETCDNIDNDCNGQIDDVDFDSPKNCGTCDNNCYQILLNNDPATIGCTPSPNPGQDPGTCFGTCVQDYFDLDSDGACEYYCVKDPDAVDDSTCNNKDDDCDGVKDEDVDVCSSTTDCGKCGGNCVVLHGTPECVNDGNMPCGPANTHCQIAQCDPGWYDLDNSYATGCEYQCTISNGGIEICGDGLDNDCDGKIDGADDLSGDPQIGVPCFGDPDGICAEPAHVGATICQGTQVVCAGPNVLVQNQVPETCNTKDDDCDGMVDDNPTDAGMACGVSNVFPCSFGTYQCQNGALVCIGAVNPKTEICNGDDDDCDGTVDQSNGMPPSDSVGDCNVPPPPPPGATSPCKKGSKACVGGSVTCVGSIGPTSQTDGCNIDANCDGVLSNQPDTSSDVNNCGSCGNSCYNGSVHSVWACVSGACVFQACEPGYYDLNNDNQCEYACNFIQAQEICNGLDDNCNGTVDEGVIAPSPVQVCGVSPAATTPECTSGVTVSCIAGNWQCTFPIGVCSPSCSMASEVCDSLDNDCDGLVNENVSNYNKPCASDEGLPPPGHGACQTFGTYVCNGLNATKCSALPADCNNLPGGCTEKCDGIDNDCDGIVDEPFSNKGTNSANFVKPVVTKISSTRWVYSYEASRPSATAINPGTGNGYWTSAPAGSTIDKTAACSEPTKVPWFNVSPLEVEQTCIAAGGFVCNIADWQTACHSKGPTVCSWGYNPAGSACTSYFTAGTKYCNLGNTYDFDPLSQGDQDGLLPTASSLLKNCWSDWSNGQTNNKIYDITGNLREIAKKAANQYNLMGGAFNSQSEDGSTCDFTFYTVDQNFKFFDTGFRCCFSADPTL